MRYKLIVEYNYCAEGIPIRWFDSLWTNFDFLLSKYKMKYGKYERKIYLICG